MSRSYLSECVASCRACTLKRQRLDTQNGNPSLWVQALKSLGALQAKMEITAPLIFTADLADTRLQSYLIIPQWSRLRSGSQILHCNRRFCDDYACICFLYWRVVFHRNSHGTAWELPVCKYIPNMDCGKPIWQKMWMKWWKLHNAEVPGFHSTAC